MKQTALLIGLIFLAAIVPARSETSFSGSLIVQPSWTHTKTVSASTVRESVAEIFALTHSSGTNANQMNALVVYAGTLTNSQTESISLQGVDNSFGDTIQFYRVNLWGVVAAAANTTAIEVGGGSVEAFAGWASATNAYVQIRPGGMAFFAAPDAAGYASTNGAHVLQIRTPAASTNSYSLYIGGAQ